MSVVDREALKEAVEILADGSAALTIEDLKAMRVAVHASLAVLEGEAIKWCYEHGASMASELGGCGFDSVETCRMVRVVVVPIGGE